MCNFIRIALVILVPFIVVRLLYRWRKEKEELKIVKLKEFIEQQKSWSTSLFNNGGFVSGFFIFFIGTIEHVFLFYNT
ncbi:MAG: hypothetical protein DRP74_07440 [Candidatus Omnitrophota bacterium]|mgnify:CR=1 FL=1|nr:MAG: hypothetical protein DRP74_07440 [Candidatus Omnitrophota bacterium]